jgi:hypothetical protein
MSKGGMRSVAVALVLATITLSACDGGDGTTLGSTAGTSSSTTNTSSSGTTTGSSSGTSSSGTSTGTGSGSTGTGTGSGGTGSSGTGSGSGTSSGGSTSSSFVSFADSLPAAGSQGTDAIPGGAGLEDVSNPDHIIGTGTPVSCTSAAVVAAVAAGGVITFDCGAAPITIQMTATAQVFNNAASKTVIDGGGLVTLSGMGQRRILYMNTCDQTLVWTTSQCDNQQYPQLTVQNLTFIDGNASNATNGNLPEGGAIYAEGGRFKVVNSRFFSNVCASTGPDTAGAAIYTFEEYQGLPVYVVHSTFGGTAALANVCSNGGALGSIGVSWTIVDSLITYNQAIGNGGNPAVSGTPGGGSGGAIYNDGDTMVLTVIGSQLSFNQVNSYGSGIFFVSDDLTGSIVITDSTITGNTGGSWYVTYPQISNEPSTPITVTNSVITN